MASNRSSMSEAVDREALRREFDEAIDVLEQALRACPEHLWESSLWHVPRTDPWVWPSAGTEPVPERTDDSIQSFSAFWAIAYHCLWFLDFYLALDPSTFESPEYVRGGTEEMPWPSDGAAPLPDMVFTRDALLAYAAHGRRRAHEQMNATSDEQFQQRMPAGHPHAGKTFRQLLEVNLEHVREHGHQMSRFVDSHSP